MKMTNKELADMVGCHHSMISYIRSGQRLPGIRLIERFSDAFNIPLTTLVKARNRGPVEFAKVLKAYVDAYKLDKIA